MPAKVRPEKVEQVKIIRELVSGAQGVILADLTGLNVQEVTQFRSELKKCGDRIRVVKNTLARIALRETEYQDLVDYLVGPNAIIVSRKDIVETLKYVVDFQKEVGKGKLKVGKIGTQIYEAKDLVKIAKLPSLQESRAILVGVLQSPIMGLVGVLQNLLNGLVAVLEEIREKRKEEG